MSSGKIGGDLLRRHAGGKPSQHIGDRDAHATDARTPATRAALKGDDAAIVHSRKITAIVGVEEGKSLVLALRSLRLELTEESAGLCAIVAIDPRAGTANAIDKLPGDPGDMSQLLKQAVATISALPESRQDEIARVLLQLAGFEQPPYLLAPDEEADLDASLLEAERGEFATDEEAEAVWARFKR